MGSIAVSSGTAANPGVRFKEETNSGFYRPESGVIGTSILGNRVEESSGTTKTFYKHSGDTASFEVALKKSRGTASSPANVANNDILGTISFSGYYGGSYYPGASIKAEVDGAPGSSDMPGRLIFSTTADGEATVTERMRISNGGYTSFTKSATGTQDIVTLENLNTAGSANPALLFKKYDGSNNLYGRLYLTQDSGSWSTIRFTIQSNNSSGVLQDTLNLKNNCVGIRTTSTLYGALQVSDTGIYVSSSNTNCLQTAAGTNSAAAMYLNYYGYQDGNTQYRNLVIADGKGATVAYFWASPKRFGVDVEESSLYGKIQVGTNGVYISSTSNNSINVAANTNAAATLYFNNTGYQDGTSQFRDFAIMDGKNAYLAYFDATNKRLGINTSSSLYGALQVGSDGIYISSSVNYSMGSGANTNSAYDFWINYHGYQDSNTQYRDFLVGNGKEGVIFRMYGSSGNCWIFNDCSATSFTDRTPGFDLETSLKIVKNIVCKDGKIDHESLSSEIRRKNKVKDKNGNEIEEEGRDLSGLVSALQMALKNALERIEVLEAKG